MWLRWAIGTRSSSSSGVGRRTAIARAPFAYWPSSNRFPGADSGPRAMQLRTRTPRAGPSDGDRVVATSTEIASDDQRRRRRQPPRASASAVETALVTVVTASRRRTKRRLSDAETAVHPPPPPSAPTVVRKRARPPSQSRNADGTPAQWKKVWGGIQAMRAEQVADVDVAGIEVFYDDKKYPPHEARFRVLISAMLSSQTKDPVNAAAMGRLTEHGLTVQKMLEIEEAALAQLIRPVGFFNNKARYIKQVARILRDRAGEDAEVIDIPNTYEELVALPGVGPKMAHLIMSCAWNNTVGICVDTHVHRISNRLGWVKTWNHKNPKAQDPEKTRKELEDWLPHAYWNPINLMLVGFGQTICTPRGPKCDECKVKDLCPSAHSTKI